MNQIERIEAPARPDARSRLANAAVLRSERASAELRAGRAVIVETETGSSFAALALDTATPDAFADFARASSDRQVLYLTAPRARALGVETDEGIAIPLATIDYDAACRLGYARDAAMPAEWHVAPKAYREAAGLARLALLLPAMVVSQDAVDAPEMEDCLRVHAGDLALAFQTAGPEFEIVARTIVPLAGIRSAEFVVFRGGLAQRDQVAIVVGDPDPSRPVPVRVHSSCLTGDLFGSLKCDCGDQLRRSLATMEAKGGGVLVYLDQEGRGTGIAAKMRAYGFQCDGLDTVDADAQLGFGTDERRYEAAVAILLALGYTRIDLMTNNPTKIAHLRAGGIEVVGRTPAVAEVTRENRDYLRTKATRAGHMIDVDSLPSK